MDRQGAFDDGTTTALEARKEAAQPKNFLKPCLLLLVKETPAHGYQLLERLHAFGFPRDPGGLYRALRALEYERMVHSWWQVTDNGHRGRVYELTDEGDAWLRSWASSLEGSRRVLDQFLGRYQQAAQAAPTSEVAVTSRGGESVMTDGTKTAAPASRAGMLRFIHYGFMPNKLGYCGPDQNNLLFQYGVAGEADPGLPPVLTKFLGPLPYLRTIASAAGIRDIFDDRVVEAYWIGNDLLDRIEAQSLYSGLQDRFRKELSPKVMDMVAGKVPQGARPHHSFHVFDVWRQVGRLEGNVLATMDSCRVSWGRVRSLNGATVVVDRLPLVLENGKLALGTVAPFQATRLVDGKGFVTALQPGDLATMHWGWICERISEPQAAALDRYTRHHIRIANQTI